MTTKDEWIASLEAERATLFDTNNNLRNENALLVAQDILLRKEVADAKKSALTSFSSSLQALLDDLRATRTGEADIPGIERVLLVIEHEVTA